MNLAQMDIHRGLSVHPRNGTFVNDGHAQRDGDLRIDATLPRSRVDQGMVSCGGNKLGAPSLFAR